MLTINDINIDFDVEDSRRSKVDYSDYRKNKHSYDEWSKKCKRSMIV